MGLTHYPYRSNELDPPSPLFRNPAQANEYCTTFIIYNSVILAVLLNKGGFGIEWNNEVSNTKLHHVSKEIYFLDFHLLKPSGS